MCARSLLWYSLAWMLMLVSLSGQLVQADPQRFIAEQSQAHAVILIAEKPAGCVNYAAAELRTHLQKITGAEFTIHKIPAAGQASLASLTQGKLALLIGDSRLTRELGIDPQTLPSEGFIVRSFEGGLAIVGHDEVSFHVDYDKNTSSAGTLYGVYRYLEQLGCRWFYPDPQYDVIPSLPTLTLQHIDIQDSPYFEYRFAYGHEAWRRKAGYGGTVDPWRTRHTFETKRVAKRYGSTHPQLVSQGFHFPHPGVMELVVAQAREYLSTPKHAGRNYFGVLPKDAYEGCQCEYCAPLRRPDRGRGGELSDLIASAVVETANQVKDLPGKVVYCAYEKYLLPPQNLEKLPENVVVLLAMHRAGFHDDASREKAWAVVDSWKSLEPSRLYFCQYYAELRKVTPSFVPRLIARDIARMRDEREAGRLSIGGEMNFGQVAVDHPYAWWFCLNEYITARLLWNPKQDVDALLDDYYTSFFGPAREPMKKLFTRFEELYNDPQQRHLYSARTIDELLGYYAQAQSLAKETPWQKHVAYIGQGLESLVMMKQKLAMENIDGPRARPDIHLSFNEGKGNVARSTAGNIQVALNEIQWTDGVRGKAIRLDGQRSFVRIPPVNLAQSDYSYELWIKPEAVTLDRSQYLLGPAAWDRHGLSMNNGTLVLIHRFQGQNYFGTRSRLIAQAGEFKPYQWHHVAATFSRTHGMAIYINGELVAMDPAVRKASEYGLTFIGAAGHKNAEDLQDFFQGVIDEVKIYRRELSPHEIRRSYLADRPADD